MVPNHTFYGLLGEAADEDSDIPMRLTHNAIRFMDQGRGFPVCAARMTTYTPSPGVFPKG